MHDHFKKQIQSIFSQLLINELIDNEKFHAALLEALNKSFRLKTTKITKEDKAIYILNHLFAEFCRLYQSSHPFHLASFIKKYLSKKNEIRSFVTAILNGLYFGDIKLQELSKRNNIELFFIQLLAEHVSVKSLKAVLIDLPLSTQLSLISYVLKYYHEGSFSILREFESISIKHKNKLAYIIEHLRRKYFDLALFDTLIGREMAEILDVLEKNAKDKVEQFRLAFQELILSMVDSPVKSFEEIGRVSERTPETSKSAKDDLQKYFAPYFSYKFSFTDYENFCRIFGFEGHLPLLTYNNLLFEANTLIENTLMILEIFKYPLVLSQLDNKEIASYFLFASTVLKHLEGININADKYLNGMNNFTCSIPTKGKLLQDLPILPSIIRGLQTLIKQINMHFPKKVVDFPIFIFDQSDKMIFHKNQKYIDKLNRKFKSTIIQISQAEALLFSKKLGVQALLDTTGNGIFGYGGARNCVSLLTIVFRHAFMKGNHTKDAMLTLPESEVQSLFRKYVIETTNDSVLMFDDDMEISESNLFSFALFAEEHRDLNFMIYGYVCGRATLFSNKLRNISEVLINPETIFMYSEWVMEPMVSLLDCLCKPTLFLNLPFPSEEDQFVRKKSINMLMQNDFHMGGTRYPDQGIATCHFCGLVEHIQKSISYNFQIFLIKILLDTNNKIQRLALPWNEFSIYSNFTCLKDIFEFISDDNTCKEIQKRFWNNAADSLREDSNNSLMDIKTKFVDIDIDTFINEFSKGKKLHADEKKSLEKIANVYKLYQKDFSFMLEFWRDAIPKNHEEPLISIENAKTELEKKYAIQMSDFTIAWSVYLIFKSIGAAEFNQHIRTILRIYK